MKIKNGEILGSVYTNVSDEWQRGVCPIARCLKASVNDLAVVMKEVGFIDNGTGKHQSNTVYDTDGSAPTITTIKGGTQQIKILDKKPIEVRVIGQMDNTQDHTFESANRVYDVEGVSPAMNTCGGGGLQPKILVEEQSDFVMDGGNYNQRDKVHTQDSIFRTIMGCGHAGNEPKVIVEQKPIRMVRTKEGKRLRKDYESHRVHHGFNEHREPELKEDGISNTISTVEKDTLVFEKQIVAMRGRNPDNPSDRTAGAKLEQRLEPNSEGISNSITTVEKDNMVLEKIKNVGNVNPSGNGINGTVVDSDGIARTVAVEKGEGQKMLVREKQPDIIAFDEDKVWVSEDAKEFLKTHESTRYRIRKLTPFEAYRLMGVSDEDAEKMLSTNSNSQCYKQAGNSIVVPVLMAIMSQLNIKDIRPWNDMTEEEIRQLIEKCKRKGDNAE